MIHVFSGCGMSRQVADWMFGGGADADAMPDTFGFVIPVYGWRVPKIVRRQIRSLLDDVARANFVWAVFTCGDDVGNIDRDLECLIGRKLDAAYSVVMPDTYLGLPGFNLDAPEESKIKLDAARLRCEEIRRRLESRERMVDLKRGPLPWIKTEAIGRFFNRFLATDRFWKVDEEKCIRCGRCARECPTGDIVVDENGIPTWKRDGSCTGCFRCYHVCEGDAIENGIFTSGKGRLLSSRSRFVI